MPADAPDEEIHIRRLPHGVVVGLTAWNYPLALAARKLGPALVAGNAFILKAHGFTPLSGSRSRRSPSAPGCRRAFSTSSPGTDARSAGRWSKARTW